MNKSNSNRFYTVFVSVILALSSFIALYYNDAFHINELVYKSDYFINSSNYVKIKVTFSSIDYDEDLNLFIAKSNDTLMQHVNIVLMYPKTNDVNFYYEKSSDYGYVIYYNNYKNVAFFDSEFDGVFMNELLKNSFSVCCIFLFVVSIFSIFLMLIKYCIISKPFVKKYKDKHEAINPLIEGFIASCLVLSFVVAIFSLIRCISSVYYSSKDWHVNYEKYEKKYVLIDSFSVHESSIDIHGINPETIFHGYYGECYSKKINNYQTGIIVEGNRTLQLNSDGNFIAYKYDIWFRKDQNIAYLPNNNKPLNSFWQELLLQLSKKWAIYFSFLLTPFFYYLKIKITLKR